MNLHILAITVLCSPIFTNSAYIGRPGIVVLPPAKIFQTTTHASLTTTSTTQRPITFHTSFGDWIKGQNPMEFSNNIPDVHEAIEGRIVESSNNTRKFGQPDYGHSSIGILTPPVPYQPPVGPDQPYVSA